MVFSRSWWIDSVVASSHRRYCKQLCGEMEIPCWVTFTCSRKATFERLKALLKVLIYANLRHSVQMFSQISRIPNLMRKFWAKRFGLYAGVYASVHFNRAKSPLFFPLESLETRLDKFSNGLERLETRDVVPVNLHLSGTVHAYDTWVFCLYAYVNTRTSACICMQYMYVSLLFIPICFFIWSMVGQTGHFWNFWNENSFSENRQWKLKYF